jgi:hypothetical protein
MRGPKYLLIGAGVAAVLVGGYVLRLRRLSNELQIVTRVAVYRVSISALDLRIEITLKNPSGGSVKVKHPFIMIVHGETTIAQSVLKDIDIEVKPFSEVKMEPVILSVGFLSLATSVPALFREYRETGQLILTVRTRTTINNSISFSKDDVINIAPAVPS